MTPLPARPSTIEAVLFDLDGVIVDSEPWWLAVRVELAAARGLTWTEADNRACMGSKSRDWAAIMQERLGLGLDLTTPEIERAVVDALVEKYAREPVPRVPDAVEAVGRIASAFPCAIASSAHPAVIEATLAAVGLVGCFGAVVSSDDVAVGKPAPDVYLEAARRLGISADRCLVVEDSLNGVLAGRAAGMTVVLVPNASVPPGEGAAEAADHVMARLADLDPQRLPG
jgi:beta-phosphoglucomutase-like phosphatase (HAD superfamily)